MGNFTIHIEGVGPHDNGDHRDADYQAQQLVDVLRGNGCTVTSATFHAAGKTPKPLVAPPAAASETKAASDETTAPKPETPPAAEAATNEPAPAATDA